jgi:hypothetical protein
MRSNVPRKIFEITPCEWGPLMEELERCVTTRLGYGYVNWKGIWADDIRDI